MSQLLPLAKAIKTLGHHLQQRASHWPEGVVRTLLHEIGTAAKFAADDLQEQARSEASGEDHRGEPPLGKKR